MKLVTKRSQMQTIWTFSCDGFSFGTDKRWCRCCSERLFSPISSSRFLPPSRHAVKSFIADLLYQAVYNSLRPWVLQLLSRWACHLWWTPRQGSQWTPDTTPPWKADCQMNAALVLSVFFSGPCTSPSYGKAPFQPPLLEKAEPPQPSFITSFPGMWWRNKVSSEKEDEGTTGKVDKQASSLSLPSAAYRITNLLNIYRKQVTSPWKQAIFSVWEW